MSRFKYIRCVIIPMFLCNVLPAQTGSTQPTKNPLTITGQLGASTNFYSSNEAVDTRPSFSWNLNGNVLARIKKWSIPASFVMNKYNNGRTPVFLQAGLSPTYGWATVHLGHRYMNFSQFTFEGQNFKGAGLELNPKHFRFASFYGKINRSIDQDTGRLSFRVPQFSRTALGVKAGYGSSNNFIDLIYFHAKDDSTSANIITNASAFRPQENAVLSTAFKITMMKKLILSGDIAVSGLIQDQASKQVFDTTNEKLKDIIDNFLKGNGAVSAGYAAQGKLDYFIKSYYTSFGYRRVQPGFRSLGTPYMLNDVEVLSWNNNLGLLQGKLNINSTLSQQQNNVDNNLLTELVTQVGNLNVNAILSQHFNLNVNASGYNLKQQDGSITTTDTLKLRDTFRLNQQIVQLNISPGYHVTVGELMHYVNTNFNYSVLNDKNPATASFSNSKNLAASLTYSLAFIKKSITLSLNSVYTKYKQENNSYTSIGPTAGISAQLLKNKNLNLQGNVGVLFNKYNESNKQRNLSYSVNSSYQAKHHSFSLYANYIHTETNNAITNAINKTFPYAVATKNVAGGVSYNYTF